MRWILHSRRARRCWRGRRRGGLRGFLRRSGSWFGFCGGVLFWEGSLAVEAADDSSGRERQAPDRYDPLMPGAEGFGQGQVVFGGGSRDVLEAVMKSLPLLGLDRGHGRVRGVGPAAGGLDGWRLLRKCSHGWCGCVLAVWCRCRNRAGTRAGNVIRAASRTMPAR
jgi:hypothetical protein